MGVGTADVSIGIGVVGSYVVIVSGAIGSIISIGASVVGTGVVGIEVGANVIDISTIVGMMVGSRAVLVGFDVVGGYVEMRDVSTVGLFDVGSAVHGISVEGRTDVS